MNIAFATSNMLRKKSYRVITTIYKKRKKLYVRKLAENSSAIPHIKQLIQGEEILLKKYPGINMTKIIQKNRKFIDYEYLPYPTLTQIVEKKLFERKFDSAKEIIERFYEFLDFFPTIGSNEYKSSEFCKIFDPKKEYFNSAEKSCLEIGILDNRFDNLLFDKGELFLIDYEWVFNFALSKDYLKFRGLYYLCYYLQPIIKTLCSEEFPCFEVLFDFYIPKSWLDIYDFSQKQISLFLYYEKNFQNHVNLIQESFQKQLILEEKKLVNYKLIEAETLFDQKSGNNSILKNNFLTEKVSALQNQLNQLLKTK